MFPLASNLPERVHIVGLLLEHRCFFFGNVEHVIYCRLDNNNHSQVSLSIRRFDSSSGASSGSSFFATFSSISCARVASKSTRFVEGKSDDERWITRTPGPEKRAMTVDYVVSIVDDRSFFVGGLRRLRQTLAFARLDRLPPRQRCVSTYFHRPLVVAFTTVP